jgi:hypothetical protein
VLLRSARVGAARCLESKSIHDPRPPPVSAATFFAGRIRPVSEYDFASHVLPVFFHFALWIGVRVRLDLSSADARAGLAGDGAGRR